ncbi:MAG: carboxypeptidase regulatory-like domain-containing protein, partial [Planctomycetota bacterium]
WTGIDMVVENGVGKVDFPVPAYLRLAETKGLKGFWIEPKSWRTEKENLVTAGDKPYKRTIVAEPAGSIYGQVLDEQGRLKRNAQIKLLLVEWPEKYENYDSNQLHQIKNEITDFFHGYNVTETGRFSTHALPMGGTYAIVAFDENTWLVSEPIKLTEEKPIREVTLHLEETTQIGGRILLPDKSPAKGVEVSLGASVRYSKEDGQGNTGFTIKTDENGTFLFEEINPQKPLKYTLRIKPGAGYQPLNVKVKPGSDKTYTLKKGYTLKGKIVDDETGWPIPGAWVGAESTADAFDYNRARTCDKPSDKDGNFIFTSLNKERYRLYLGGAEIVPYESRNIDGGQTKEVNLRVKLQSWSQLKPRKPDNEAP